ncbi:hypothetical protein J2Y48_002162 [Mycoplana sp. BE70]|nr:hypothetical protein [Mycoplana sp. BE70]
MLDTHSSISVIPKGPELGDIRTGKHVAIHEDAPALVVAQVRDKESGKGKLRRLQRIAFAVENTAEIVEDDRKKRHRGAGMFNYALTKDVISDNFFGIEADKNAYKVVFHADTFRFLPPVALHLVHLLPLIRIPIL